MTTCYPYNFLWYIRKPNLFVLLLVRFGMEVKLNSILLGDCIAMRHEKSQTIFILQNLHFNQRDNLTVWVWKPTCLYTIKSLYTFLCFDGVKTCLSKSIWSLKTCRLRTKDNLYKPNWIGDVSRVFCSALESVDHLFFKCPFIIDLWGADYFYSSPKRVIKY
jgi:zinc-binding in reverse transcriptase